jgi:hypothetical protein
LPLLPYSKSINDLIMFRFDRKKIENNDNFILIYNDWKQIKMTAMETMEKIGMKNDTFFQKSKNTNQVIIYRKSTLFHFQ